MGSVRAAREEQDAIRACLLGKIIRCGFHCGRKHEETATASNCSLKEESLMFERYAMQPVAYHKQEKG